MVLRAVGVGLVLILIASLSGGCIPQRPPDEPAVIVVTNVQARELESVDEPAAPPQTTEEVAAEQSAPADAPAEDDEPDP